MTIDLATSYAKAAHEALPNTVLVSDRFHLVALANDMLAQVRQRLIRESCGGGRQTDPGRAVRRRLLTGHERLPPRPLRRCGTR